MTMVADDVHAERLTDGAVEVASWQEVEVELAEGDRSDLDAVSVALQNAGLNPSDQFEACPRARRPDCRRSSARTTSRATPNRRLSAQCCSPICGSRWMS